LMSWWAAAVTARLCLSQEALLAAVCHYLHLKTA
jgi:hypothetical protein